VRWRFLALPSFFFFQAEDGIRDGHVTGVQTCALPISQPDRHYCSILSRCDYVAPNGSRLSCGRNAHQRKAVEQQIKRLAGEATQFLPTCERPAASSAC